MKKILLRILFLLVGVASMQANRAAVLTVTSYLDGGTGSLRDIIATASSGDTITFSVNGTLFLNNNILWDKSLTIIGPAPAGIKLDGNYSTGLLQIAGGNNYIKGITFQNAWTNFGAGIDLPNNGGQDTLLLENCVFRNCRATGQGGAISSVFGRYMALRNCWIDSCFSDAHAAGIYARFNCELTACTFSNCKALTYAGAAYLEGPDCRVTNCTFWANSAGVDGSAVYLGGDNTTISLVNNSFAANQGSSVFYLARLTVNNGSYATMYNNLFSNAAPAFSNGNAGLAFPTATGGNVTNDFSLAQYFGLADLCGSDALAGRPPVMGTNGGTTPTVALSCTSTAIDFGLDAYAPATDQRGVPRNHADAGAYEYTTPVSSTIVTICSGDSFTMANHTYSRPGTYTDTLDAGTPCLSVVHTKLIVSTVQDTVVTFSQGTFFATPAQGKSFRWVNCTDGYEIPGATVSAFTPSHTGSYSVIQTQNGCSVNSGCFPVEITVSGIAENTGENIFSIWPNPTTGSIQVMFENKGANATLRLINAFGNLVMEKNNIPVNQMNIDLSAYAPGIYIVEVTADNQKHQNRLVKN
jgi:hypothetical protein